MKRYFGFIKKINSVVTAGIIFWLAIMCVAVTAEGFATTEAGRIFKIVIGINLLVWMALYLAICDYLEQNGEA